MSSITSKPPFVFISYSHKDIKTAEIIEKHLRNNDINTWRDKSDMPISAQDWSSEVWQALQNAEGLVLLWSKNAAESDNVADEWSYIKNKKKPILIVQLDNTEIHYRLIRMNWIGSVSNKDTMEKLAKAIKEIYGIQITEASLLKELEELFINFLSRNFEEIEWEKILRDDMGIETHLQVDGIPNLPEQVYLIEFTSQISSSKRSLYSQMSNQNPVLVFNIDSGVSEPDDFLKGEVWVVDSGNWEEWNWKQCDTCHQWQLVLASQRISDEEFTKWCPRCETECLQCGATTSLFDPNLTEDWCSECLGECARCEEPISTANGSLCSYCQYVWDRDYEDK